MQAVMTAVGLALPGAGTPAELLLPAPPEAPPVDPAALIGKKGLRYQDRATQLALCAADDALRRAGLLTGPAEAPPRGTVDGAPRRNVLTVPAESVAVVASSNLGNLDTVQEVVQVVARTGSSRLTSPIVTPRLSSNVVASETAIRFTCRGPNLMLCNGPASGLDAVFWAMTLLAAGRAEHVLVVGVEPATTAAGELLGEDRVIDAAVALVLERPERALARGATVLARLGRYLRTGDPQSCVAALSGRSPAAGAGPVAPERVTVAAWTGPEGHHAADGLLPGVLRYAPAEGRGTASGALGVLQCATAAGHFGAGGQGPFLAVAGSAADDATAGLLLHRPDGR